MLTTIRRGRGGGRGGKGEGDVPVTPALNPPMNFLTWSTNLIDGKLFFHLKRKTSMFYHFLLNSNQQYLSVNQKQRYWAEVSHGILAHLPRKHVIKRNQMRNMYIYSFKFSVYWVLHWVVTATCIQIACKCTPAQKFKLYVHVIKLTSTLART